MRVLSLIVVNFVIFFVGIMALEYGTRIFIDFEPGYYTGIKTKGRCINYPYGAICLNTDGYPDSEFGLKGEKPRIGYFGDSICYGVAAGQGYRITDLLRKYYKKYEHYNFCYLGENLLNGKILDNLKRVAEKYDLDHIVYLMNLNDVPPLMAELAQKTRAGSGTDQREDKSWLVRIKEFMIPLDERLRGKSYLYTYLRNIVKERLTIAGYEASGYKAIEMFPKQNEMVFKDASARINSLQQDITNRSKDFTLVVLPYEMQISDDAAAKYSELNIRWGQGFTSGAAQDQLIRNLSPRVRYFNVYDAFTGIKDSAMIGDYYVYNKGDKIDWNHPNREGHRVIAGYLINQGIFLQ